MVLAVFSVVLLCLRMSFRRLVWRSGSLVVVVVLFLGRNCCVYSLYFFNLYIILSTFRV
jgi:hypothetical protein